MTTMSTPPFRALVTGAGHGIGRAIALGLGDAGADVVVHYGSSRTEAEETVAELQRRGRGAVAVQADLRDTAATEAMVARAAEQWDGLDVVVCNAGHLVDRVLLADLTDEHYAEVMDVNLGATVRTVRAALPHLRRSDRARVITMSSLAAHNGGGTGASIYAASKAAILGLTKAWAKELGADGITVNAVAPGFIDHTRFHERFNTPEGRRSTAEILPVGRGGHPDDVAAAVTYLATEPGFLSGTTIDIDGGAGLR